MGVVYQAIHPGLGLPVAIKVLAESFSADESFRIRFQREAATAASLNHPGIVRVYDFDTDEGSFFIVMEFVEGRSLRYWLNHSGRFRLDVGLDLIQQLLSAVGAAHARQIVHRDLKPENVLVTPQGKTKILDFGISKVLTDGHRLTATGAMVGTPAYMAPEQVRGEDVDHRADIYSLGVILYELLHGEPPFTGPMPSVLHAQVFTPPRPSTAIPPHIMVLIEKALAKAPDQRFQSCDEFAGALMQAVRPEAVRPLTPPPDAPPPQTAHRLTALIRSLGQRRSGTTDDRPGGCAYTGCPSTEGWPCAYVDARNQRCATWWCRKHVVFMDAAPFCPRHASVIRALAATAGTIREIKHRPDVNDRALPLAALVAEDADRDISELIRRRFKERPGVRLAADRWIRQTWEGRGCVAWERSWSALKDQGYLARVSVRVTAAQPDVVKVAIGPNVVFEAVPDWISRRREGEAPDPADRARFRAKVVDAVLAHIDSPTPLPTPSAQPALQVATPMGGVPRIDLGLAEGLVLRVLSGASKLTAFELCERLALPYPALEPALDSLVAGSFIDSLGLGPSGAHRRPLPERMMYAINRNGRARLEGLAGTRYTGPAPVSLEEYRASLADAGRPHPLTEAGVAEALRGLEVPAAVGEVVRAAVSERGSLFIYGSAGNGKTSLARRVVALLGEPILVPIAIDAGGEVIRVFDPAIHRPAPGAQPADQRWRRVERPLVQVGGEFLLEMLEPTWEATSRTYEAPLQVKAAGGVLLIDDLGRQRVPPKAILDRLQVPLEQRLDFLNLASSGRKIEVPFAAQLVLSTNLKPADLLDEAYLRRLAYKVQMPDPTWDAWVRIFERERERMRIPPEPRALEMIRGLYGGRPLRGNHPRDLLERLQGVATARGVQPLLRPDLIEAAWRTLFVAQ